jgi:uncharacterized phage-like protein YoqJ
MIMAATGHRPNKLGGYDPTNPVRTAVRHEMLRVLRENNATKAISGMALGVDQDFFAVAHTVHRIPVIAAVPFLGQEKMWPPQSREVYKQLLTMAHSVVYVCSAGYQSWKMQKRNEWMVDNCDILLAVWDGSNGGTGNCVKYAESVGRKIIRINPKELDVNG